MGIIKGVLKEELDNSIQMKKNYQKALKALHGGSIVKKNIKGHIYYYLAYRSGRKVRFVYKGKGISKKELAELSEQKRLKGKYREFIKKLNRQIKYLRKAVRGKEDV